MTEIEKLVLSVESKGATKTNQELDRLDRTTRDASRSADGLEKSWLAFYDVAAASAAIVYKLGSSLVQATVEYQDFNAQLRTATGTVEKGAQAFRALEAFAASTPYAVSQSIKAFVQLTNLGLTPSERALRSYGNTASAMNKELTDLVEAVADAATGEFERLKEFGIKARKDGEEITFIFQGIKTTVANTASAIEGYLIKLGEVNFAGSMEARMQTVGGALSNIADAWQSLQQTVTRSGGVDNVFRDFIVNVTEAIQYVTTYLGSGQASSTVQAYKFLWHDVGESISLVFGSAGKTIADFTSYTGSLFGLTRDQMGSVFSHFPIVVTATVRSMTASFEGFVLEARSLFRGLGSNFEAEMDRLSSIGIATAVALKKSFTFGNDNAFAELSAQVQATNIAVDARKAAIADVYTAEIDASREATNAVQNDIAKIMGDETAKYDQLLAHGEDLRETYIKNLEAQRQADLDSLATNRKGAEDAITKVEKEAKVKKIKEAKDTASQIAAEEKRIYETRLHAAEDFFGNIASIGSTFGEKGFKIAQAASIAQATIKTYESATSAYAALAGIPYVGPALGAAAAAAAIVAGAANIAQIKAQKYQGAYAEGGMIPAGKYGLVGEAGPEIVAGPAIVTSAASTRSRGESSRGQNNITIQNYGSPVSATAERSGDDLLLILRPLLEENKAQTKREVAAEVAKGGTQLSHHLENTYNLRRSGR